MRLFPNLNRLHSRPDNVDPLDLRRQEAEELIEEILMGNPHQAAAEPPQKGPKP